VSLDRGGRLVVYPLAESFHAAPVRVLDADVDDRRLGAAVRAALEADVDAETALEAHRDALRGLGLTLAELDSAPSVGVYATSKGLELEGWRADGSPDERARRAVGSDSEELLATEIRGVLASLDPDTRPQGPTGASFGYKLAWLAIRGRDTASVAEALGLARHEPATWEDGVDRASDGASVFVSPPTGGWVFALHAPWLDEPPDLAELSARLETEVQYFATHRVPEAHAWARAADGRVLRTFRSVGETGETAATGVPTSVERRLGDDEPPDEQTVMEVAAAWSVDPRTLGSVASDGTSGAVGYLGAP